MRSRFAITMMCSARLTNFRAAWPEPDTRVADAVCIVQSKRQTDGRWLLDARYNEALAVALNESVNKPSLWITLRALRVLRWYEQASSRID